MNGMSVLDETPRRADRDLSLDVIRRAREGEMEERVTCGPGEDSGVFDSEEAARIVRGLDTFAEEEAAKEAGEDTIKFTAAVWKVSTTADLGIRVVLDLPETAVPQMAMLAECHRQKMALDFEATQHGTTQAS